MSLVKRDVAVVVPASVERALCDVGSGLWVGEKVAVAG